MKQRMTRPAWLHQLRSWTFPALLGMALATAGLNPDTLAAQEVAEGERAGVASPLAVQTAQEGELARQFIMYPTGERETSVLMIEKIGPAQVRAGQPYDYQIRLTNLTGAPLAGVVVRQSLPHGVSIDAAEPAITRTINAPPAAERQQQQQQQRGEAQQARAEQQEQGRGLEFATAVWQVGELGAGETRTINVRAFASEVGVIPSCITADYEPTLCAVTEVVNPELRLVKVGPEIVDICEPLAYTYTVTNLGTGIARNVVIQDPLPEGLVTEDGLQQVEIEVGELAPNASRDFPVALKPSRPGQFASRAVAISETDKVYSDRVATEIVAPNLAVEIDGPASQYIDERFTYAVAVTNTGDAPAEEAILSLNVGDGVEYVRIPTPAAEAEPVVAAGRLEGELANAEIVPIGTLAPGETKRVRLTFVGREEGERVIAAIASAECVPEPAKAAARTYIATVPALQLWVVDADDPVTVGGETTYIVSLRNEGSGPARNVVMTGTLPQPMTFIAGTGDTSVQAEGQNVVFGPIDTLPAGKQLQWRIRARAQNAGDVQFRVQLKSDDLTTPAVSSEPTKLVQPAAAQ